MGLLLLSLLQKRTKLVARLRHWFPFCSLPLAENHVFAQWQSFLLYPCSMVSCSLAQKQVLF